MYRISRLFKIMIATNKKTGKDITKYVVQYLAKEITKDKFEQLTELKK